MADLNIVRRARYWFTCLMVHRPAVLRALGRWISRSNLLSENLPVATTCPMAAQVFRRSTDFSHAAHAPALVAGEFTLGMTTSPAQAWDRELLEAVLPDPQRYARRSALAARDILARLQARHPRRFDLIHDYGVWIVWAAHRAAFGRAGSRLPTCLGAPQQMSQSNQNLAFFAELRHLGANLFGGASAPAEVQRRAKESSKAVRQRVELCLPEIRASWARARPGISEPEVRRNAVGLLWVAHPASVQALALVVQELLKRPLLHRSLRRQTQRLGDAAWSDAAYRTTLRAHVIELLRFHPPFPVLPRECVRDTEIPLSRGRRLSVAAGDSVAVLAAAAMFDPAHVRNAGKFDPERTASDRSIVADTYFLFGDGTRACIAQEQVLQMLVSGLTGLLTLPKL
ncbi:MAG TPA: cytochrome P450, partial [Rhizobacter sp.]